MPHFCLASLFLFLTILNPRVVTALIDLSITQPKSSFTTNNKILEIQGSVALSEAEPVVISIDTPAGISRLSDITHSIYAVTMDLGSVHQLGAILFSPRHNETVRSGPMHIGVTFSEDGFLTKNANFDVPPGLDSSFNANVVDFSAPTAARFVQLYMLEGWNKERISIHSIEFLDTNGHPIKPLIQSVSILLEPMGETQISFSIQVSLKSGPNQISVTAMALSSEVENQDTETISVIYLADIQTATRDGEQLILSDGRQATIVIPAGGFGEDIRKIQFLRMPPDEIDRSSYQANSRIAEVTSPVVAYRFDVLKRGHFGIEATSSLSSQPPALAVDGILEPPSTWMAGLVPLPIYLTIDLGDFYTLGKIVVHPNVIDERSFGPQNAKVLVSSDNLEFTEILEVSNFEGTATAIHLPSHPSTRFIRLGITESKQVNNVQLNEVEIFDVAHSKISRFLTMHRLVLEQPALLEFRYDRADLLRAGIRREEDLRVFAWTPSTREWHLAGGEVDLVRQTVRLELNYITQFAVFQAMPPEVLDTRWSLNPFSPDGNGIGDTTQLMISNVARLATERPELVVEIYDLHSKLVKTLINRWNMGSDSISIEWNGKDRNGRTVSIGAYVYQVRIGAHISNGVIAVGK